MLKAGGIVLLTLGVLAAGAGGVGQQIKPEANVTIVGAIDTPVLVVPPEVVKFVGDRTLRVMSDGTIDTWSGRPVDAEAWVSTTDSSILRGVKTWEELAVDTVPSFQAADARPSADIWRTERTDSQVAHLVGTDFEAGATVVVASRTGNLSSVELDYTREVGFGWVPAALVSGAGLAAMGLIMLVMKFLDLRPAGARVEEATASVRKLGKKSKPGIRRSRREAVDTAVTDTTGEVAE